MSQPGADSPSVWRHSSEPLVGNSKLQNPVSPTRSNGDKDGPRRKFPNHLVEIYDIETLIGQGAFSTVWRCTHRATGQVRAVKKIDTSELSPREIAHEIALMRLLRHENVVRCYDVFLEAQFVNIVVDMFPGGDLVDGLNAHRRDRGRVPDAQLAALTRQMVAAIAHVHSLQIVHRDIKGENFLCDRPDIGDLACRVALADFGSAVRFEPGEKLCSQVGTQGFWAPEVWTRSYDFVVDIWALGVTVFILLSGALPFQGEEQICAPATAGKPLFAVPHYASRGCTDFITRCLEQEPEQRPQASEVVLHSWLATPPLSEKRSSPSSEEVSHGASAAAVCLLDCLGAVVLGLCSGFICCIEVLVGVSPQAGAAGGAGGTSSSTQSPAVLCGAEEIEKHIEKHRSFD